MWREKREQHMSIFSEKGERKLREQQERERQWQAEARRRDRDWEHEDEEEYRRTRFAPATRKSLPRVRLRRSFPGQGLILDLLDKADDLRERQKLIAMELADILATGMDPDDDEHDDEPVNVAALQKGWNAFVRGGGVSADDLRAFLRGEKIGPAVRVKRHLRLVRSNPRKPLRLVRTCNGNDAV
jgi:hypothetical protein